MKKVQRHQYLPTQWAEREKLRDKGQFWTPSWVANAMVTYVSKDADIVFDPASGEGAFYEALKHISPEKKFYGIDIDPLVLQSTNYSSNGCQLEVRDFIKDTPNNKFKAIVANPPYIRHHRIDELTKILLKQMCVQKMGFTLDGRAGLHIYFLVQALELLETGGRLAFIMPADTCEGKSAQPLWKWITSKYCVECVATFSSEATPFPNVDTNALVFFISNKPQEDYIIWSKINEPYTKEFTQFVENGFCAKNLLTITTSSRSITEALETGFSRPQPTKEKTQFVLSDFARILRGIATGSNEFFFLTKQQIADSNLNPNYFKRAIGRTRDVQKDRITIEDLQELDDNDRPTYLLSLINDKEIHDEDITKYLAKGKALELPTRPLIMQRKPWYKMEKREVPALLFAYLGRRDIRFILNEANALPLTAFLCVYPNFTDKEYITNLWKALNHPETLDNLQAVGKSYGSGAIKVEPNSLRNLPIPNHIVTQFNLKRESQKKEVQFNLF
jgi:adenine-specific DNA-methyltransferase